MNYESTGGPSAGWSWEGAHLRANTSQLLVIQDGPHYSAGNHCDHGMNSRQKCFGMLYARHLYNITTPTVLKGVRHVLGLLPMGHGLARTHDGRGTAYGPLLQMAHDSWAGGPGRCLMPTKLTNDIGETASTKTLGLGLPSCPWLPLVLPRTVPPSVAATNPRIGQKPVIILRSHQRPSPARQVTGRVAFYCCGKADDFPTAVRPLLQQQERHDVTDASASMG